MIAEISSKNANQKFLIHIVGIFKDFVIITLPKKNSEYISFLPTDKVIISSSSKKNVYSFSVCFCDVILINGQFFYKFSILDYLEDLNFRVEERENIEYKAIYKNNEQTSFEFATILDISQNGMKIETSQPIDESVITIIYNDEAGKKENKLSVAWKKIFNQKFYYGLSRIS